MKKLIILIFSLSFYFSAFSQVNYLDFGTTTGYFICNPPVYTTTGQSQCTFNNPVSSPAGSTIMYSTTSAAAIGLDCRNWLKLENPGFSFIGSGSELQLRNAGNGVTALNPARFLVKDFSLGNRFGITFDVALAGLGGEFLFRCGSGEAYGDTVFMYGRDSSSFMVLRIDNINPAISGPKLTYSNSLSNTIWPNTPVYNWQSGINGNFPVYQKHTVAIFCNNTNVATSYDYLGIKTLNPQSYDVYLDSVLDADNVFDNFFGLNRSINSFMFCGASARCANGGEYLGDTLIVDNIRWTSDFVAFSLPVHLSSFTAKDLVDKSIRLDWRDETPEDGVIFDIQVSTNGRDFRSIGKITEKGDKKDYSFIYPNKDCGKLFFRLAFEGKYSEIRTVDIPCDISIIAYQKSLRIQTKTPGILTILNTSGQLLARTVLANGYSQIPLDFLSGVYIANFVDKNGNSFSQKFLIK